jgi:uncharacterized protein YPO0396
MSLSLFSNKPEESGFRLHTFEIWNWGTFDSKSYKIEPLGETSLLTGANASGKTTLVDGLLTLLVPERRMRFYNQTAGLKGERTEDSYVLGEYGEVESAEPNSKETKKLRGDKSKAQSILLAIFQNESSFVTLAQARWFSNGELKRVFILARRQLSISNDFFPFDNTGDWKKRLRQKYPKQGGKEVLHLLDSPGEYGRLMQNIFGMRSEKAHTLFSQTIGLKVLGDLNEFVRVQMLEERNSETEFQKIKAYFKTLNDAHKAIEKAYEQIELLKPIRDKSVQLTSTKARLLLLDHHKEVAPLWFAQKQDTIITDIIARETSKHSLLTQDREKLELELTQLSEQERDLDIQIKSDEVGKQISDLERRNKDLEVIKSEREDEVKRYNELAELLELQLNPSAKGIFDEQRSQAIDKKKRALEILEQNDHDRVEALSKQKLLNVEFDNISNELALLRRQTNNITGATARIRSEILQHLGTTEKEMPFVGELIKVREDAKDWEPVIEKLLHSFALRLVVPDEYSQKVNSYVNQNDLQGRIIYNKFNKRDVSPILFQPFNEKELINKLDFKPTEFTEWVKTEIIRKYNYLCIEDLEEFRLSSKSILKSGLIKNLDRHEKDDRPEVKSRQQFVLGWDNKEKKDALRAAADTLSKEISQVTNNVTYLKNLNTRIKTEEENLTRFIEFNAFRKIDWWSVSSQIQENRQKVDELQKTNDRIKTLKKQRDDIMKVLHDKTKHLDLLRGQLMRIESEIEQYRQKIREVTGVLNAYSELEVEEKLKQFESAFGIDLDINIGSIEQVQVRISKTLNEGIDKAKDEIRAESSATEALMRSFTNPSKAISEKFEDWNSDTHLLRESAEFIDEYVALLERIEKQELAEHKKLFKKYLNEEMITKMSDFQTWLERQEEDIEEKIETLNKSLEKINFKNNPPTFIRLHAEKDYAPRVKDFKLKLNDWKPNLVEFERTKDETILEESFNKIKTLLDNLTTEENTRKEVLDVRNWLKFRAVELHREDPTKTFRSYTGTAKLSGGEGSQLTYTILGSAIAYQFGIHSEGLNTNSFRFICVDEAFSKQDDEKARFLMELCKQLHLQLMVVSPAKAEEVAIVEPYIARVHFVQRKDNRNSIVFDMPIKQLQEHRQKYLEAVV